MRLITAEALAILFLHAIVHAFGFRVNFDLCEIVKTSKYWMG